MVKTNIYLYDKVCINLAKNKEISPNFLFLNNYIKRTYDTEKYNATINNKSTKFYKDRASLKDFWEK